MNTSRSELEKQVHDLIHDVLRLKERTAAPLRRIDVREWDSLKHVEIVFALEDEFDVQFDEAEFALMDSSATIAALLRQHLEA